MIRLLGLVTYISRYMLDLTPAIPVSGVNHRISLDTLELTLCI
jgi:hypothetical protein